MRESQAFSQGWMDPETHRHYVMGPKWSKLKYYLQRIDLHLYKCHINPIGAGLLLGVYVVFLIQRYW